MSPEGRHGGGLDALLARGGSPPVVPSLLRYNGDDAARGLCAALPGGGEWTPDVDEEMEFA